MSVDVDQVRAFLRYDGADNDEALTIMLGAAVSWVERHTGILMTAREVFQENALGPPSSLRWGPYHAGTLSIEYLDASLSPVTFTGFVALPSGRVFPTASWPRSLAITLTYTAGVIDPADVPESMIHAVCVYCSLGDQTRGEISEAGWTTLRNVLGDLWRPVVS
jgi:hypothetical protein